MNARMRGRSSPFRCRDFVSTCVLKGLVPRVRQSSRPAESRLGAWESSRGAALRWAAAVMSTALVAPGAVRGQTHLLACALAERVTLQSRVRRPHLIRVHLIEAR